MHTLTAESNHAGRQPAHPEKSALDALLRDTSTLELGGAGDQTSNLAVASLYPLSYRPLLDHFLVASMVNLSQKLGRVADQWFTIKYKTAQPCSHPIQLSTVCTVKNW